MMNVYKSEKGSITVEAAFLFPVILLCILLLIYAGLIYYHSILVQSVADELLEDVSFVWMYDIENLSCINKGIMNKNEFESLKLYWNLELADKNKKNIVAQKVKEKIQRMSIFEISNSEITDENMINIKINVQNYLIYKVINMQIIVKYNLPTGNLFKAFGIVTPYKVQKLSRRTVTSPREFINDTDMFMLYFKEFNMIIQKKD